MTKKASKPCICCTHYNGGIPCQKGHRPRMFIDGGLRRVCSDFATQPPVKAPWYQEVLRVFGMGKSRDAAVKR